MTTAILLSSGIAIWGTAHGLGPFARGTTLNESLFLLHTFISITAVMSLVMAAVIAERNQAEETKRESQEQYELLVEQARDIIYRTDDQGCFTFVNPIVTRIMGYSPQELLGRRFIELIRPDTRAAAERFYGWQSVRKTPSTYYEFPALTKDGREIWIGQNVQVLLENGQVTGFHAVARDITGRKQTEEALAASEKHLRTILEAEPECVKVTTEDGVLLSMNAAGLAMIEADSLDQVIGQSVCPLIAPAHRDAFAEFIHRVYRGESGMLQFEMVGLKGRRLWMDTHAVPLRDEHNATIGVLAITRDITERKRTEESLQQSDERFRSAFGHAAIGMALVSTDGRWLQVNPALCDIVGYSEPELLATTFQAITHPDDLDTDLAYVRQMLAREIRYYQMEKRYIHKRGHVVWILLSVSLVHDKEGKPLHFISLIKDITERKRMETALRESETQTRLFMEATADCIWNWDLTADCVTRNAGFERLFGYAAEEIVPTIDWWAERLHPDDRERVWVTYRETVASGRTTCSYEYRFRRRDGSYAVITDHVFIMRDSTGKVVRTLGAMTDITERKRTEEVLQERANLSGFSAEVGLALNRDLSTDEILRHCTEAAVHHLGAAFTRIWTVEPGDLCDTCHKAAWCTDRTQCLHLRASAGLSTNLNGEFRRIPLGALKIGRIAQGEGVMFTNDVLGDERLPNKDWLRTNGLQSFAGFPLMIEGKVFGVMGTFARVPLSKPMLQTLESICNGIASTIARKQGEERLRESEEQFRRTFDDAPIGMATAGRDYRFIRVNQSLCDMLGYTQDELTGKTFLDITHPEDKKLGLDQVNQLFLGTINSFELEKRYLRKDRSIALVHLTVTGIRDKDGEYLYNVAMIEDITERKWAEEALRESEAFKNRILDSSPDCIQVLDQEGRLLFMNKGGQELMDICDITPLLNSQWVEFYTGEDTESARAALEAARSGNAGRFIGFCPTATGKPKWWDVFIAPLCDANGVPERLLCISRDITERKRTEEGLRERSRQQAIEAELSLLAVAVSDFPSLLGTAVKLVSNALEVNYCEVLELLPNGTDLRLCASAGWRGDRIGQVRAVEIGSLAHVALHSIKPMTVQSLQGDTRYGGPAWLHEYGAASGMSVSIPGKESSWGVLGVYTAGTRAFSRDDINFLQTVSSILATAIERMQAESVLKDANQALRLLSRQLLQVQEEDRRTIARDLHDEIGQSLTAIKLNVERAQRTSDREARARIMQDCAQIIEHVLGQVRDLSLDLHPSILDDLGLAYALKWYADRQAERAGLKVEVTADPSLPRLSPDIEIACFRIAQEALTNVVRHAQARFAGITLKRGAAALELCIQDDGIGFIVGKASFPANGGASVGLASMQERAKLLGGTVKITSAPRRGTKVIAMLPLVVASPAGMPKEEAPRS